MEPVPQRFFYLPPAVEEQRAFAVQFIGSVLGLALLAALAATKRLQLPDRAVLWGVSAGILYLLARAAWQLERKAQRATRGALELDAACLRLIDGAGRTREVAWQQLTRVDVAGGRLLLQWPGGAFAVGSREIENGLEFVRAVMHCSGREAPQRHTNFIPLEPK